MADNKQRAAAPTQVERPRGRAPASGDPGGDERPTVAAPVEARASAEVELAADRDSIAPESLIGKVIDGRYRILSPLAEGGMGSVFLAEQTDLRRKVALKVLVSENPELVVRFQREATALAEVSHPAIVEIYDFTAHAAEAANRGCLCMAFIDGMDLADYLDEQPDRRLPADEVMTLMIPVISALVELHANGIIHRDIKPANLVRFNRADGRPGVKLVDFGIARRQVDPGMTASGLVLGTPPYLPPEAFLGEPATPLMDIYALGATIFELLTGAPPFDAKRQSEIIQRTLHEDPQFPDHLAGTPLADLLKQMLGKVARKRPDAMQVLRGLEQVRAGQRPSATLPPEVPAADRQPLTALEPLRASAPAPDRGRGLAVGLAVLAALEAAAILYLLFGR